MATEIHPTAVVSDEAQLGVDVRIGPQAVIGPAVTIGDRTRIGPQVVIDGVTRLGADNIIVGQANIGGAPQDFSYEGEPTHVEIGDRNTIREFVTINRGTIKGGGVTTVGDDCLFMACCHIAHDCEIGSNVVLANNALLAGHVAVDRGAIISGAASAHQFVTVGSFAYVGGMTRIIQDVPPFMVLEGHPSRVRKVNVIGLERAGFTPEAVQELKDAFKRIFRSGEPRHRVVEHLRESGSDGLVRELVNALRRTELGLKGRYRESLREEFRKAGQERFVGAAR